MLDDGDDPRRHEAGRADGTTRAGHLGDLDRAAGAGDLDTPAGAARHDLEALDTVTHVHDDLDPITLHDGNGTTIDAGAPPPQPGGRERALVLATWLNQWALGLG
jgi:hypothetical protein